MTKEKVRNMSITWKCEKHTKFGAKMGYKDAF